MLRAGRPPKPALSPAAGDSAPPSPDCCPPKPLTASDGIAVLVRMVFGRFVGVMCRMKRVPLSDMRVVRRFLVIARFMVRGSFAMLSGCLFVVFCRLLVVLGTFVGCHGSPVLGTTELDESREANPKELPMPTKSRFEVYSGFVTP